MAVQHGFGLDITIAKEAIGGLEHGRIIGRLGQRGMGLDTQRGGHLHQTSGTPHIAQYRVPKLLLGPCGWLTHCFRPVVVRWSRPTACSSFHPSTASTLKNVLGKGMLMATGCCKAITTPCQRSPRKNGACYFAVRSRFTLLPPTSHTPAAPRPAAAAAQKSLGNATTEPMGQLKHWRCWSVTGGASPAHAEGRRPT